MSPNRSDTCQIFTEERLDLAFWFTFAGYHQPTSTIPIQDVDLASYGLASILPAPGSGYNSLGGRPRLAYRSHGRTQYRMTPAGRSRESRRDPPPRVVVNEGGADAALFPEDADAVVAVIGGVAAE
jgi:hypothetical protein